MDISTHSVFGNALRSLIIDATPHHSIALWHLRKLISEATAISPSPNGVLFKSDLQGQYSRDEKDAKQLDTYFTETRYDQKCLAAAFSSTPELESIIFEYDSMEAKLSKFRKQYCEISQHEMSRPFVSTLSALSSSPHLKVNRISISVQKQHGAISIGRLESIAPLLRTFDDCFEKLEVLKLHLRDWRDPGLGFELDTGRAPFIVRFLAKARNVRHLSLSCHSSFESDILGHMSRHCDFPKLETCWFALFSIFATDLLNVLKPSCQSLRSLDLRCMRLLDHDTTWSILLQSIIDSNGLLGSLELLRARQLFTLEGTMLQYGQSQSDTFEAEVSLTRSGQWRKESLDMLEHVSEKDARFLWHTAPFAYPFDVPSGVNFS